MLLPFNQTIRRHLCGVERCREETPFNQEGRLMKSWSVRQRIIIGFSAVILVMVALSVLAFVRLRGIAMQAAALDRDSIPGLYLVGRMQAVSVQTYLSTEQHILERDPAQM